MKKFLLMLAMMLPCLGAWAEIQPSTNTDAPENLYKIKSKNGLYMAAHSNPTQENYGRFAFYAVDGKENTYKIYSYDADLWLSYTKKSGYSDGMNFVSFAQTQENANEWCVTKATNGYYQVAPYNTTSVAGRYWNFYGGIDKTYYAHDDYRNTLGLYNKNADGDGGSAWTLEAVATDDYTAPTTLNYEITDGNGNAYTGTYTGVAGRTRIFTHLNTLCPITDVTFEGNTYKANITFPVEVNKNVFISLFNDTNHKVYRNVSNIKVKMGYEPVVSKGTDTYDHYLWKIVPEFNNSKLTFTVQNVESTTYMFTEPTDREHGTNTVTLGNTATKFEIVTANGAFALKLPTTRPNGELLYLSASSSTTEDQPLGAYTAHNGTKLVVIPADVVPCTYRFTDIAENVYEGTYNGIPRITHPEFAGVMGQTYANDKWNNTHITATINFTFKVSGPAVANPILMTNNGKLWRAEKYTDGYYVHISTNNNDVPELGTWQWLIYPFFNNGEFTFKIMNVGTGLFVYVAPNQENDPQGSNKPVKLQAEGTTFKNQQANNRFAFIGNGGTYYYLTVNGTGSKNCPLGVWNGDHSMSNIGYPNMTKFTFNVSKVGWATLYTPFAGTISGENDVKTYAITADDIVDGYAKLTELTGVAANQGAIIEAAEGTYTFTAGNVSSDWNDNLLTGTSVNTLVNESAYVLALVEGEAALALAELNMNEAGEKVGKETGTHFLNNAGKAYLPASAVSTTAQALRFNFGGNTTAIESVLNNGADANAPIYDLTGRRIVNAVKGGIYIQNGKKFIVK